MSIRAVKLDPVPPSEAKAKCASCGRPMAMLKAKTCLYCGAANPDAPLQLLEKPALPPELMLGMQPRAKDPMEARVKWFKRTVLFSVVSSVVSAIIGACMKHH
jgi:hypothetical protein